MKKLSFFLMAMLISLVSFAQDAAYKTALFGASYNSKSISSYTDTWTATNDGFTVTIVNANNNNNGWEYIKMGRKNNASVGSITTKDAIDKPVSAVTLTIDAITASKINSLTLKTSTDGTTYTEAGTFSKAKGDQTVELTAPAANLYYQIVADCASGSSNGLITISKVQYFASEGGEQGPTVATPVFDVTEPAFKEAFTLTITSEEGTTLKYTTDNTDPITSATAIEVATNTATVAIPAKSTVVKAVAIKDELTSKVKSVTYGFVNTPETAYTVSEAIDVINAGLGLDNELYAKGEIYKIDSYNATYKSITYWIKDEAGKQLQVYSGRGLNNTDFASKDDLVIGTKVVICGLLKKYNSTTYEFDKTNYIVSLTLPSYTVTATAENGSVEGLAADGKYEHGAEATLTATAAEGYEFICWTSGEDTVSTANPYKFTVTADVTLVANFKAVEPTTITYELNGGELPTVTVPTQDSLIAAFKDGYNAYFGVSVATTRVIENFLYAGATVNDPTCDVSLFMKDDASPWKWLGDYVLAVTNAQIEAGTLSTLKELATELMWRQSLTGFFLQQAKLDSNYKGNADFTEAGKPEAWGAAYQAAHAVVLPTEPVDAPYTLPTPVKEGYKFVGWYDNAEGKDEPYTVIPAGWSGTLYAIWEVQGPTTALDNIAIEGKVVKTIINGQLIIINNGVQYNALGQVIR